MRSKTLLVSNIGTVTKFEHPSNILHALTNFGVYIVVTL